MGRLCVELSTRLRGIKNKVGKMQLRIDHSSSRREWIPMQFLLVNFS